MTTIQLRRGTAAQWAAANPVLAAGEPGFATDTGVLKIGDGTTAWSGLASYVDDDDLGTSTRVYVDPVHGSDANDGLTPAHAKATIPAALTALGPATGVVVPMSGVHTLTTTLTVDATHQALRGEMGAVISATGLTSGDAIAVTSSAVNSYNQKWPVLSGFRLVGPGSGVAGVVGISFDTTNSFRLAGTRLDDLMVQSFDRGVELRNQTWANTFVNCHVSSCAAGISVPSGSVNAGERNTFVSCNIFNNVVGISHPLAGGSMSLLGCSLDYNRQHVVNGGGRITLSGCHVEGSEAIYNGSYPMEVTGDGAAIVMEGGRITGGVAGTTTPAYVHNTAPDGSGGAYFSRVSIDSQRFSSGYFSVGGGHTEVDALVIDNNNQTLLVSSEANLVVDPGFDLGTLDANNLFIVTDTASITSRYTGSNLTLTRSTTGGNSSAPCLKVHKVGAAGTAAGFVLAVPSGRGSALLGSRLWWKHDDASNAGSFTIQTGYAAVDRQTNGLPVVRRALSAGTSTKDVSGGTVAWTAHAPTQVDRGPAWATHVYWAVDLSAFVGGTDPAGTLFFDDFEATIGL